MARLQLISWSLAGTRPANMNTLLQPIRRVHPFNLVCGDYLSLPASIGNFKTLGVYIDTCSNFIWVSRSRLRAPARQQSTQYGQSAWIMQHQEPSCQMAVLTSKTTKSALSVRRTTSRKSLRLPMLHG